ncbi:MAG: DNA polymerase I [Candidatus Eremiobacteraeota bacterium]|nr:DNA polymerase I [Candidatus Eremiobacteraeota bacterium]
MLPAPDSATLMLLDTYGLVYRAYFALPVLTTSKGVPINAAYGFTMMLNKIIADERPTHVIAAFDKGMPHARVALYADYKANRTETPDDLRSQFALVRRILDTYHIPIIEVAGEEADDVIATLADQAKLQNQRSLVVTGDLDLLQIVDDRTTVLVTRRGITDLGRYDRAAVRERFELEPEQLPDYRGLKGDPSDNLPGIPGVGERTAIKLLKAAGSLDELLENPQLAGVPKLQLLVEQYGRQARTCRDVSVVSCALDVAIDWEHSLYAPPGNDALYSLYRDLEFKSLLTKLDVPADLPVPQTEQTLRGAWKSYVAATDLPDYTSLAAMIDKLRSGSPVALALRADEVGLSNAFGTGISFLISALDHEPVRSAFAALWSYSEEICAYDTKSVLTALAARGFAMRRFDDDAMIGAHLLNPSRVFNSISDAAQELLSVNLPEDAGAYADATLQLVAGERQSLHERAQLNLYDAVEVPLAAILAKIEATGIAIDLRELEVLAKEIEASVDQLQKQIYDLAGEKFNIGSPQQLGAILFGKLDIPGGKQNKTGWATGVEVLAALARQYPICAKVLEYREVTKLKNTYIDVIPKLRSPEDGRLRTVFNQTATATGRLSSTNPNLQNIPIRGELGRRIRRAFVAPGDGRVLLAADYSQIELRLMAHLSQDAAMRSAFHQGQDIHDFTAREIFNLSKRQMVDQNQRRMAKSVNFGLLYGMSDFGLAQRLEISRAQAKQITAAYFARFPAVRAYIDNVLERGREEGFVATILGRRRYMPALRSKNYMLRAAAEREATNAPLQGSAADLMKLAMVRVEGALHEAGVDALMLLQIHDELIFEVGEPQLRLVGAIVRREMENALKLSVPVEVTMKVGRNWYDVEEHKDL